MSQHNEQAPQRRFRGELALNIGAVAGVLCILVAAASMLFGVTPLVFRSGSMSPGIPTGSLALARTVPAADLSVGDVVSVDNQAGTRISHRVVAIEPFGDQMSLTLKGDANRAADPVPYVVSEADRVMFSVPFLGYVATWLSSKTAIFLGGILAGALLMLAFGPHRRQEPEAPESDTTEDGPTQTSSSTQAAELSAAQHQENIDA